MARELKETFFFGMCTGKLKLEHLLDLYSCRLSIMREESWVLSMKSRLWIFTNILLKLGLMDAIMQNIEDTAYFKWGRSVINGLSQYKWATYS